MSKSKILAGMVAAGVGMVLLWFSPYATTEGVVVVRFAGVVFLVAGLGLLSPLLDKINAKLRIKLPAKFSHTR